MNYEAIKLRIGTLIKEAQAKPHGRIDATLEPIRGDLLEARRQGVRLRPLYDAVIAQAKDISPSSFAKYAQRHLRVKKTKDRQRALPPATAMSKPSASRENLKAEPAGKTTKPVAGKPRIATGNY